MPPSLEDTLALADAVGLSATKPADDAPVSEHLAYLEAKIDALTAQLSRR